MRRWLFLFLICCSASFAWAKPRFPFPKTPDEVGQNDRDLDDEILTLTDLVNTKTSTTSMVASTNNWTAQQNFQTTTSTSANSTIIRFSTAVQLPDSNGNYAGMIARTDGGEIASGVVGSTVSASAARSSVVFPSGTTNKNIAVITLTAGLWEIRAHVVFSVNSGNPGSTQLRYGIDTSSGAAVNTGNLQTSTGQVGCEVYPKALAVVTDDDITGEAFSRIRITANTNYYLNASVTSASGVIGVGGIILATKI